MDEKKLLDIIRKSFDKVKKDMDILDERLTKLEEKNNG